MVRPRPTSPPLFPAGPALFIPVGRIRPMPAPGPSRRISTLACNSAHPRFCSLNSEGRHPPLGRLPFAPGQPMSAVTDIQRPSRHSQREASPGRLAPESATLMHAWPGWFGSQRLDLVDLATGSSRYIVLGIATWTDHFQRTSTTGSSATSPSQTAGQHDDAQTRRQAHPHDGTKAWL